MVALPSTYPVQGIFFFVAHPQLWSKTLCPFLLTLIFGILSLVLSFVYLLPLQAHALINAHCPAWLAWVVSVIFVLLESAILDVIFFAVLVPIYQDALFDATLKARGLRRMFDTRVPVDGWTLCCRGIGSGIVFVWFLVLAQASLRTDPYGAFTSVACGRDCFGLLHQWLACMQSYLRLHHSWGALIHYDLEFRGFSIGESRRHAWKHREQYCQFGIVAVALELIPLFNLIFMWTNIVGAALWIADEYEQNERDIARHPPLPYPPIPSMPYPSDQHQALLINGSSSLEQQRYGATTKGF